MSCPICTSSLPWYMDLTFQIPMQYCHLQHWTLLSPPDTSTTGIVSTLSQPPQSFWSYFSCLVSYWAPTNLGSSSFSVVSFCLFILFMGFSRKECWSGLPFPSPVDHILSELSMTHPSWMALHCLAHSFIEWTRLWSMWSIWSVSCDCGFHSACPLTDEDKRLVEASWREGLAVGKTGSCCGEQGHAQ